MGNEVQAGFRIRHRSAALQCSPSDIEDTASRPTACVGTQRENPIYLVPRGWPSASPFCRARETPAYQFHFKSDFVFLLEQWQLAGLDTDSSTHLEMEKGGDGNTHPISALHNNLGLCADFDPDRRSSGERFALEDVELLYGEVAQCRVAHHLLW